MIDSHPIRDRRLHSWRLVFAACIVVALTATSLRTAVARDGDGAAMLGGPEVPESAVHTLVNFDATGKFVRIEGRPEDAALDLLPLDEQRRGQTIAALRRRSLDLGLFLVDHLELLQQLAEALKTRDSAANRAIVQQLYDKFDPDHVRDPLLPDLQPILTQAERQEMTELLDEYWGAWIDRELGNAKDRSEEARERTQRRLTFTLFEQELRRSFDTSIRPYREKLDLINATVEPTDEQREAIRAVVIEFVRETRLEPTPQQRLDSLKRIYLLLDEDRRTRLFEMVASLQGR